jgi:hypothetical protein
LIKNYNVGTLPEASIKDVYVLQKKPSARQREHPALQNMKFLNFFLLLWVIFALLDPDFEYGSGSKTLSLTVALLPQDEEEYNEDIPNPTPAMREVMKKRRSLAVTPMKAV